MIQTLITFFLLFFPNALRAIAIPQRIKKGSKRLLTFLSSCRIGMFWGQWLSHFPHFTHWLATPMRSEVGVVFVIYCCIPVLQPLDNDVL
jgi:hypothetical protein